MVQAGNHALNYPTYAFRHLPLFRRSPRTPRSIPRRRPPASRPPRRTCLRRAQLGAVRTSPGVADWPDAVADGMLSNAGNIELWDYLGTEQRLRLPQPLAQPGEHAGRRSRQRHRPDDRGARRRLGARLPRAGVRDGQPRDDRLLGHQCGAAGERHAAGRLQRHADVPERRHARRHQLRRHRVGPGQRLDPVVRGLARPGEHGAGEPPRHARLRHRRGADHGDRRQRAHRGSHRRRPGRGSRGFVRREQPGRQDRLPFRATACSLSAACKPRKSLPAISRSARAATPRCSRRWRPAPTARQASRSAARFEVLAGGTARFTGTLGAPMVQVDAGSGGLNGGTLSGGGTLSALGGGSILNNGTIEAVADLTLGLQRLSVTNNVTGTGTLAIDAGATLLLGGSVASTQAIQFAPNTAAQFANGPYSPSTLVLAAPLYMFGAISGFTFADRLVLEGVTAVVGPGSLTGYNSATQTLTIQQQAGPTLTYSLAGSAPGDLAAYDLNVNSQNGQTIISFVSPTIGAGRAEPRGARRAGGRRRGAGPGAQHRPQHAEAVTDGPRRQHPGHRRAERGVRHALRRQRQRQYQRQRQQHRLDRALRHAGRRRAQPADADLQGGGRGNHHIDLFVSDWAGISTTATIPVFNNAAPLQFNWNNANGGSFGDIANWTAAPHSAPPGGANIASFGAGTYTVSGDGAVAQIVAKGTTTLTGQVTAQGRGGLAMSVDGGGALTLAGGAQLTVEQEAIVGEAGQGLLVVMGGALDLSGPAAANALVIGQQSGSSGTVVNLEQITASGTVIVGGAGTGALELLGVAVERFGRRRRHRPVRRRPGQRDGERRRMDERRPAHRRRRRHRLAADQRHVGRHHRPGDGLQCHDRQPGRRPGLGHAQRRRVPGRQCRGGLQHPGRGRRAAPASSRSKAAARSPSASPRAPSPTTTASSWWAASRAARAASASAATARCWSTAMPPSAPRQGVRGVRQQCRRERPRSRARSRSARAPTTSPCSRCWERSASPAPARSRWAAATPPCAPAPSTSPRVERSPARARCRAWAAAIAR